MFLQQAAAHFTKKLRRDTEVRSDVFLRNAIYQRRIARTKIAVAIFCAQAEVVQQALLVAGQRVFYDDAEKAFKFRNFLIQDFLVAF